MYPADVLTIIFNVSKQNYKEASKKFEYDVELKQTKSQ